MYLENETLENISDLVICNENLAVDIRNNLSCFISGFVIFKLTLHIQYACRIFISSILETLDHRLSYEAHSYTLEIRMTDDGTQMISW